MGLKTLQDIVDIIQKLSPKLFSLWQFRNRCVLLLFGAGTCSLIESSLQSNLPSLLLHHLFIIVLISFHLHCLIAFHLAQTLLVG